MSLTRRGRHRRRHPGSPPIWLVACSLALAIVASPVPTPAVSVPGSVLAGAAPYDVRAAGHEVVARRGDWNGPASRTGKGTRAAGSFRAGSLAAGYASGTKGRFQVVIPSIGVDAPVIDLGLNSDGTLQVPANYAVAGWYAGGPEPGDLGPSVIVGHVDSRNGPAVFYRLRSLSTGDVVNVYEGKRKMRFVVLSVHQYPKDAFPTKSVYGRVDYPAIRLITCGGAFNPSTGHYTDNIVVYGKLS